MSTVVQKAFALLVRPSDTVGEVLLFEHVDGTIHIPKGTVDPGEDPRTACVRELGEETGVWDGSVVEQLPAMGVKRSWDERQLWFSFVIECPRELPDQWDHVAEGSSDEAGLVFRCHWVPLTEAPGTVKSLFRPICEALETSGWASNRLWDAKAEAWDRWVGVDGDRNRRLNSDPVLWRLLGAVAGQRVLDAGCGTGYLSAKLVAAGARVDGIDAAPKMVAIAQERVPGAAIRVDDLQRLETCGDATYDAVVTNYVLMDLPDLEAAVAQMARVLRPGGRLVAVFSHPAFPPSELSYFARGPRTERWGTFETDFLYWHRPIRDYLQALLGAGLALEAFEEPVIGENAVVEPDVLQRLRRFPYSIALRCRRSP